MLPEWSLRLAIGDALVSSMEAKTIVEKLFREDPDRVLTMYNEIATNRLRTRENVAGFARRSERLRLRPLPTRKRIGMRVPEIAAETGIAVATLNALLEHHGFLELVPFGGQQRRRLVTDEAFRAGLGHNVTPANRIGHLEGFNRAAVFPVFYPERLPAIQRCLDLGNIKNAVGSLANKRQRLAWLMAHHAYLPDAEIASLAGYRRLAVLRARQLGAVSKLRARPLGEQASETADALLLAA